MAKLNKRMQAVTEKVDADKFYPLEEVFALAKETASAKFDESVGNHIDNLSDDAIKMDKETYDDNESLVQDNKHTIEESDGKREFLIKNQIEETSCSEEYILALINKNKRKETNREIKEMVHIEQSVFTCNQCGSNYQTKYNLRKHIRRIHKSKLMSCNVCDFSTKFKQSITRHIIKGHEKKFLRRKRLFATNVPSLQSTKVF